MSFRGRGVCAGGLCSGEQGDGAREGLGIISEGFSACLVAGPCSGVEEDGGWVFWSVALKNVVRALFKEFVIVSLLAATLFINGT